MPLNKVPPANEGKHPVPQFILGRETGPSQTTSAQDREEDLDLIHPRGVQWGVAEHKLPPVPLVEPGPTLTWSIQVDIEVVPNHDHLSGPVIMRSHALHEVHKILSLAGVSATSKHLTSANVKGGQKALGPMSYVFKFVAPAPSRKRALGFVFTLVSLHARLLINTQDHHILGPVSVVDVNYLVDLDLEVRIGTMKPHLGLMRFEIYGIKAPNYA